MTIRTLMLVPTAVPRAAQGERRAYEISLSDADFVAAGRVDGVVKRQAEIDLDIVNDGDTVTRCSTRLITARGGRIPFSRFGGLSLRTCSVSMCVPSWP